MTALEFLEGSGYVEKRGSRYQLTQKSHDHLAASNP